MNPTPIIPVPKPTPRPKSRSKKLFWYFVILVSVLLIVFLIIFGTLNYKGFCFKQVRYLSDEEKLNIAIVRIGDINRKKPRCWSSHGKSVKSINRNYDECVVPYSSIEEFLQANPVCCKLLKPGDYFDDSGGPGPWTRLFGTWNYGVKVQYVEKRFETPFKDKKNDNIVREYTAPKIGIIYFNNCGEECEGR